MHLAIFVALLALWLSGIVTPYTLGGFIHLLLLVGIVAVLFRVIQGGGGVIKFQRGNKGNQSR